MCFSLQCPLKTYLQGTITDILEENVLQPLLVSTSAIRLASETVRSILKIDDIVSLSLSLISLVMLSFPILSLSSQAHSFKPPPPPSLSLCLSLSLSLSLLLFFLPPFIFSF